MPADHSAHPVSIQDDLEAMTDSEYRAWQDVHARYSLFTHQWHVIALKFLMDPIYDWMYELHKLQGLAEEF